MGLSQENKARLTAGLAVSIRIHKGLDPSYGSVTGAAQSVVMPEIGATIRWKPALPAAGTTMLLLAAKVVVHGPLMLLALWTPNPEVGPPAMVDV